MKRYLILFLSLCYPFLRAQDTIVKKDGFIIVSNVIELGEFIKYYKADNPTGPVYSIAKAQVGSIRYKNGTVDEFKDQKSLSGNKSKGLKFLSIYTNVPKNMLSEFNVGLEYGLNKHFAAGISFGLIHTNDVFDPLPLSPSQERWPGTVYVGYACSASIKIYTAGTLSDYWNFQILGKTLSYEDHEFTDKVYDDHYDNFTTYKRNENATVLGFSIMHGHEYTSANGFLYIDFFYGFGIRYRERRINTIETRVIYHTNESYPHIGYTEQFQTFPVIETGFKIGFNFKKKEK